MRHEIQVELIRRALANIEARRTDDDGEPFELSVDRYLDPAVLERERAFFRSQPVVVGFASQVASPGEFFTHDYSGVPLIVTGDRVLINACRHRGTRIADGCGQAERFVCPYHAWTYNLSGRLEGVPHRHEFGRLEERNLVEVPSFRRFGLIFAGAPPRQFPFAEDLSEFDSAVLYAPSVRTKKINWKLMMDGSWESYHFRVVHAKTIAPLFFDNIGVFDFRDPDLRMVLPKRSILELREVPAAEWSIRPHANIIYGLFPNTIVLVQPDHAMVVTAWPVAVDQTVITSGMLIPEAPLSEKAHAHWQKNEQIFWNAIEEDLAIGERIQSTLASRANSSLLFGKNEHLIEKFHRALERGLLA